LGSQNQTRYFEPRITPDIDHSINKAASAVIRNPSATRENKIERLNMKLSLRRLIRWVNWEYQEELGHLPPFTISRIIWMESSGELK
jgi:hypothetical protein